MSLKDKILSANDTTKEMVEVPEWGVTIEVRSMTGAARARIMSLSLDESGQSDISKVYPEVIIGCCFDPETGEAVFTSDDREMLMHKNAAALDKLATVASELSGFTDKAVDKAGKGSLKTEN